MDHAFTKRIKEILASHVGPKSEEVFEKSQLLQYINIKTRSATRGSKARSSFANLYALYVLIEDYIKNGFDSGGNYSKYAGAIFSNLFRRQRELPFGSKLQNHALNHRLNEEFKKYFPTSDYVPIIRDVESNRYWINQNLLKVSVAGQTHDLALAIIQIIDAYIQKKRDAFELFIKTCKELETIGDKRAENAKKFITALLEPNVDARLFEIVGYAILKHYYYDKKVYFGFSLNDIVEDRLKLYKTGRTNANDGGIDYVMRPLGRFFQVTETLDAKKYFLDIDKIERFPLTFVIKSLDTVENLRAGLQAAAQKQYSVVAVVDKYMACIEEIINIPVLKERFDAVTKQGHLRDILNEIVIQSMVEFNYPEEDDSDETE
jgi:hypothetical protein